MDPMLTKLLVTVAAVLVYAVSYFLPALQIVLWPLAGAMVGAMWGPTPGTVSTDVASLQSALTAAQAKAAENKMMK